MAQTEIERYAQRWKDYSLCIEDALLVIPNAVAFIALTDYPLAIGYTAVHVTAIVAFLAFSRGAIDSVDGWVGGAVTWHAGPIAVAIATSFDLAATAAFVYAFVNCPSRPESDPAFHIALFGPFRLARWALGPDSDGGGLLGVTVCTGWQNAITFSYSLLIVAMLYTLLLDVRRLSTAVSYYVRLSATRNGCSTRLLSESILMAFLTYNTVWLATECLSRREDGQVATIAVAGASGLSFVMRVARLITRNSGLHMVCSMVDCLILLAAIRGLFVTSYFETFTEDALSVMVALAIAILGFGGKPDNCAPLYSHKRNEIEHGNSAVMAAVPADYLRPVVGNASDTLSYRQRGSGHMQQHRPPGTNARFGQ